MKWIGFENKVENNILIPTSRSQFAAEEVSVIKTKSKAGNFFL